MHSAINLLWQIDNRIREDPETKCCKNCSFNFFLLKILQLTSNSSVLFQNVSRECFVPGQVFHSKKLHGWFQLNCWWWQPPKWVKNLGDQWQWFHFVLGNFWSGNFWVSGLQNILEFRLCACCCWGPFHLKFRKKWRAIVEQMREACCHFPYIKTRSSLCDNDFVFHLSGVLDVHSAKESKAKFVFAATVGLNFDGMNWEAWSWCDANFYRGYFVCFHCCGFFVTQHTVTIFVFAVDWNLSVHFRKFGWKCNYKIEIECEIHTDSFEVEVPRSDRRWSRRHWLAYLRRHIWLWVVFWW